MKSDTIVATSSPAGESPRGIVRLSGTDAIRIASAVFDKPLAKTPAFTVVGGKIKISDIIAPAQVYVMRAPRSYTKEDIVEFHVPGSAPILSGLVDALLSAGARAAGPGEFTRRAFMNGRLDLAQAEAVQALISANNLSDLRAAQAQLSGSFSRKIESIRDEAASLLAHIEATIDFSDQDIQLIEPADAARAIGRLIKKVNGLAGKESAAPPKRGVATVICGLPNAGKSSLLNALSGTDRSIVTHIAGTTRDVIEHSIKIGGVTFRLIDTAGVKRSRGKIEKDAVDRTDASILTADLILFVVDSSQKVTKAALALLQKVAASRKPLIIVLNKSDISAQCGTVKLAPAKNVRVSALAGNGVDKLRATMSEAVSAGKINLSSHSFWASSRHKASLKQAASSFESAKTALEQEAGLELAAEDLRAALDSLGEIVGATTPGDILDAIFSSFCIGK